MHEKEDALLHPGKYAVCEKEAPRQLIFHVGDLSVFANRSNVSP